ncbi:MAG: hypothetical protein JWM65_1581 [Sphingomonas bacterium]|nr:hypothetical protein [Sphingomonas bacterium]
MIGLTMLLLAAGAPVSDARCSARVEFNQAPQAMIDDPDMAMEIAKIYLIKFYGTKVMKDEVPLRVSLQGDVWHLTGRDLPRGNVGGVAEIDLCRSNGQVLRVVHGE